MKVGDIIKFKNDEFSEEYTPRTSYRSRVNICIIDNIREDSRKWNYRVLSVPGLSLARGTKWKKQWDDYWPVELFEPVSAFEQAAILHILSKRKKYIKWKKTKNLS